MNYQPGVINNFHILVREVNGGFYNSTHLHQTLSNWINLFIQGTGELLLGKIDPFSGFC